MSPNNRAWKGEQAGHGPLMDAGSDSYCGGGHGAFQGQNPVMYVHVV